MPIKDIKHKGLRELFEHGQSRHVDKRFQKNALLILDHLDAISDLADCMGVRKFHPLIGNRAGQYAMSVSGNWRITFTWDGKDIVILDLEDYH